MSNVQFEEDNEFHRKSRVYLGRSEPPFITKILINTGFVRNQKQASIFMIVLIIIILFAIFTILKVSDSNNEVRFTDKYGREYTSEEYAEQLRSGVDILKR